MKICFTVLGRPQPQGSSRMFPVKTPTGNHMILTSANRALKPWRKLIAAEADVACCDWNRTGTDPASPVRLIANFYFAPPKKMPKGRKGMTTKPDLDKLLRAVCDGITSVLIEDDSQVVDCRGLKLYGTPERAEIEVEYL